MNVIKDIIHSSSDWIKIKLPQILKLIWLKFSYNGDGIFFDDIDICLSFCLLLYMQ
jgi:hypothetical protein